VLAADKRTDGQTSALPEAPSTIWVWA